MRISYKYSKRDLNYCIKNYLRGKSLNATVLHLGKPRHSVLRQLKIWRDAGHDIATNIIPVGVVKEWNSGGHLRKRVKTEDGWRYLGPVERKELKEPVEKKPKIKKEKTKQMPQKKAGKRRPTLLQTMDNPEGFKIKQDEGKVEVRINNRTVLLVSPDRVEATKLKYGLI